MQCRQISFVVDGLVEPRLLDEPEGDSDAVVDTLYVFITGIRVVRYTLRSCLAAHLLDHQRVLFEPSSQGGSSLSQV